MNITFINRMMGIKFGGGENFDLNMARALKKRGHDIRFIIGREWRKISLPLEEFDVTYIKTPYLRDIHYKFKPSNIFNKIISVGALEFDLWLFENAVFSYLKKDTWSEIYQICGLPRLGAILGGHKKATGQRFKTVIRWPGLPPKRKLKYMQRCDINFANGDAFKTIKENIYNGVKNINLGIDLDKFYPTRKKDDGVVKFLFVGRIVPIKNLPFLIRGFNKAFMENKNIILNIVGDGDESEIESVKKMAIQNKNINFLGNKKGYELVRQYQENDVFIIVSSYDNYPNVVFEAMASGLPVIGTNVGGIPSQIVDRKTGILVRLNDIDDLKESILVLANNRNLREQMGKNGRRRVEQEFSWDQSAVELEKLYQGIRI